MTAAASSVLEFDSTAMKFPSLERNSTLFRYTEKVIDFPRVNVLGTTNFPTSRHSELSGRWGENFKLNCRSSYSFISVRGSVLLIRAKMNFLS